MDSIELVKNPWTKKPVYVKVFGIICIMPHFLVHTDNNPLTYVLLTAKLNATAHRWVAELADINFSIVQTW